MMEIQTTFGPHAEPIARAGYLAYYEGRPHSSWEALGGHQTFRWLLAAEDAFSHPGASPQRLRAVYLTGYAVDSWEGLVPRFRERWRAVAAAMAEARQLLTGEPVTAPARRARTIELAPVMPLRQRLGERRASHE